MREGEYIKLISDNNTTYGYISNITNGKYLIKTDMREFYICYNNRYLEYKVLYPKIYYQQITKCQCNCNKEPIIMTDNNVIIHRTNYIMYKLFNYLSI